MTTSAVEVPPGAAGPPGLGRPKVRPRPTAALLEPEILRRALLQSFVKLDPRLMVKIPVMFVVEIGSVITTIEFLARPDLFVGLVTAWLWATVLLPASPRRWPRAGARPRRTPYGRAARRPTPGGCARTAPANSSRRRS